MPRFSATSQERIETLHPDLQVLLDHVIEHMDVVVLEGHRPETRQDTLFTEGRSQVRWPNSKHNDWPSRAVDIAPYAPDAPHGVNWSDTTRFHQMGFYVLGIADALYRQGVIDHRVRWGNDWNRNYVVGHEDPDEDFYDGPHFELVQPLIASSPPHNPPS